MHTVQSYSSSKTTTGAAIFFCILLPSNVYILIKTGVFLKDVSIWMGRGKGGVSPFSKKAP